MNTETKAVENVYWPHKVKKTAIIRNSSCHYTLHMRSGARVISIWLSKCPDVSFLLVLLTTIVV